MTAGHLGPEEKGGERVRTSKKRGNYLGKNRTGEGHLALDSTSSLVLFV